MGITYLWQFRIERRGDWLVVEVETPEGRPWEMPSLADALRSLAEERAADRFVLELGAIDMLNSQVIGQLLAFDKWIRSRHGAMRLCGVTEHNVALLQRLRLGDFFSIYRDRAEAIAGRSCAS